MTLKIVIDHIDPADEAKVLTEINKLAAAQIVQFRVLHTNGATVNFGSNGDKYKPPRKVHRDPDQSTKDVMLEALREWGPLPMSDLVAIFVEKGFNESTANPTSSRLKADGKIRRDEQGLWHLCLKEEKGNENTRS